MLAIASVAALALGLIIAFDQYRQRTCDHDMFELHGDARSAMMTRYVCKKCGKRA